MKSSARIFPFARIGPHPKAQPIYPRKISKEKNSIKIRSSFRCYSQKLRTGFSATQQRKRIIQKFSRSRAKQCPACYLAVHLWRADSAPPSPPASPDAPLGLLTVAFSASPWSFHGFSEKLELLWWRRCHVSFLTCLNFSVVFSDSIMCSYIRYSWVVVFVGAMDWGFADSRAWLVVVFGLLC